MNIFCYPGGAHVPGSFPNSQGFFPKNSHAPCALDRPVTERGSGGPVEPAVLVAFGGRLRTILAGFLEKGREGRAEGPNPEERASPAKGGGRYCPGMTVSIHAQRSR